MRRPSPGRALRLLPGLLLTAVLCLFYSGATEAAQAENVKIAVTSPWLYEVASFIGGRQATVRALSTWGSGGATVPTGRPRAAELVIAFDPDDAARFKISKNNTNLRLLYKKVAMSEDQLRRAFFDPAMLPFIAQEIMKIIAAADTPNYAYYQRRLAEFQSRIDSTMGIGRHMLRDKRMLDLTGAEGTWVRSSISGIVRPPDSVWKSWLSGDGAALKAALDEASKRGWLVLLDPWTPEVIRNAAAAYPNRLTLPVPPEDTEFFVFLHEIFTMIANRVNAKPAEKK